MSEPERNSLMVGMAAFAASDHLNVGKDGTNKHFNYSYMTEPALFRAARAALAEQGLSAIISFEKGKHEHVTLTTNRGEKAGVMATLVARMTIFDQEGNSIEGTAYGQGVDEADKAYAKAMTMASKYVVQKMLMVAVDADDVDGSESPGTVTGGTMTGKASPKQLKFLANLIDETNIATDGNANLTALRLARMQGDPATTVENISKAVASDLIERMQKVGPNGPAVLARLFAWEVEHGFAQPAAGEVMPGETANEAMARMETEESTAAEMQRAYPEANFDPATEPPPPVVEPPPTVETPADNIRRVSPGQIAMIHVMCRQAGFTDERRAQVLKEVTGEAHTDRVPASMVDALKARLNDEIKIAESAGGGE